MEHREKTAPAVPHQLILQERKCIELSGVTDVENFDENTVNCCTALGRLTICGSGLHLQRLDLEGTSVSVEGTIDSLTYTDVKKGGFFGRLFR